ncbi:alanine racemase [Phaeodactylibacter luteus]|uniref:Alanine/ornithine racemase family PLP-dependent enzyme n=1 Tax=Phaeodactylibacter luteus TaxID=1564516 RepID=A0A5C6S1Z6_9BACT|nr:alanine/ornithine racemase family PLP-dependent enzyme [Phaeodactylibacter luteus]TXB67632.1 alanine/ornithine racemase family PLP-dependent enzyme [Phaeodactylibacter luteus]
MAYLTLNRSHLKHNYQYLNNLFQENGIEWAIVTKLLCGNEDYLQEVISLGIKEVCDSRIYNLAKIKAIAPDMQTVYIKPPAMDEIEDVVRYADVSFNSESTTIKKISEEAQRQGKTHRVTIMIELGDLREGIMGENLVDFYDKIFELPNIEVVAIGSNLNCLHGVMPSEDKLIQLNLYKQLVEAKFNKKIPWVTGGTSVVLPLLFRQQIPKGINHFRIGETLYFGVDLFEEKPIPAMKPDVFRLYTQIIEITKKPKVPIGQMAANPSGDVFEINEEDYGKESYRAILDIGTLDISVDYLIPDDESIEVVNASSDMLVVDLGGQSPNYKVGDAVSFQLKYMGALSLLNSDYIEKRVIE